MAGELLGVGHYDAVLQGDHQVVEERVLCLGKHAYIGATLGALLHGLALGDIEHPTAVRGLRPGLRLDGHVLHIGAERHLALYLAVHTDVDLAVLVAQRDHVLHHGLLGQYGDSEAMFAVREADLADGVGGVGDVDRADVEGVTIYSHPWQVFVFLPVEGLPDHAVGREHGDIVGQFYVHRVGRHADRHDGLSGSDTFYGLHAAGGQRERHAEKEENFVFHRIDIFSG